MPAFSNFFLIPHEELNLSVKMEEVEDVNVNYTTIRTLHTADLLPDMPSYEKSWVTIICDKIWHIIGTVIVIAVISSHRHHSRSKLLQKN